MMLVSPVMLPDHKYGSFPSYRTPYSDFWPRGPSSSIDFCKRCVYMCNSTSFGTKKYMIWLVLIARYTKTFPLSTATALIKDCIFWARISPCLASSSVLMALGLLMLIQCGDLFRRPSNSPGKKKQLTETTKELSVVYLCRKMAKIWSACCRGQIIWHLIIVALGFYNTWIKKRRDKCFSSFLSDDLPSKLIIK